MGLLTCHKCQHTVESSSVSRYDVCPQCGSDSRACLNCRHYDAQAYNGCQENQAERVTDKERANFCSYFSPAGAAKKAPAGDTAAKDAFERLFK